MLWSVVEREVAEVVRFGAGKQTSKATDHTSVLCQTTATPVFNHWHSYGFLPGLGVYCRLCENHRDCDCFSVRCCSDCGSCSSKNFQWPDRTISSRRFWHCQSPLRASGLNAFWYAALWSRRDAQESRHSMYRHILIPTDGSQLSQERRAGNAG